MYQNTVLWGISVCRLIGALREGGVYIGILLNIPRSVRSHLL